jgi:hypothetical protein
LQRLKGRGTASNDAGRFEAFQRTHFDDGWSREEDDLPTLKTHVTPEIARTIIARNTSPDISFDRSSMPYRGCEHGCTYCYARPTHAYMGLSAGLDFESRLFAKTNAAELLRKELVRRAMSLPPWHWVPTLIRISRWSGSIALPAPCLKC